MNFTIAICTHNRQDILEKSLDAALNQDFQGSYEVLVLDNASTDRTRHVVQSWMDHHPRLRLEREPRQGLSHARNRAIKAARGDFLVYVDDDAALCPDYLARLDGLIQEESSIGAAGGPIEIGWLGPAPPWYESRLDIWYNKLDHGKVRRHLAYPKIIYGTNMAFPKHVLEQVGGFHPNLGRAGQGLADSEDLEILLRIARAGLPIVYDPGLSVTHFITPDRLSRDFLRRKAARHGRYRYMAEAMHAKANPLPAAASLVLSAACTIIKPGRHALAEELVRAASFEYIKSWISRLN